MILKKKVLDGRLASLSRAPASVRNTVEMQARNVAMSLLIL